MFVFSISDKKIVSIKFQLSSSIEKIIISGN